MLKSLFRLTRMASLLWWCAFATSEHAVCVAAGGERSEGDAPKTVNVIVINIDPVLKTRGGVNLHTAMKWSDPWQLTDKMIAREGFFVMNEAPGWMKRTETNNWAEGIRVMYDTDIFPFERSIAPGETFTSAKSGIAFFQEEHGFWDPHWIMPLYTAQVLMQKGAGYRPRWFYNTWEPFFQDYNENICVSASP